MVVMGNEDGAGTRGSADAPPYDVVLSYAGEDRDDVDKVASAAEARGLVVFYDQAEQARLWGCDLYQHLHEVYSRQGRFCVVFISRYYVEKVWTRLELHAAQSRALRDPGYLLPVRLDDSVVPGLPDTIAAVDLRVTTPVELVELLAAKLAATSDRQPPAAPDATAANRHGDTVDDIRAFLRGHLPRGQQAGGNLDNLANLLAAVLERETPLAVAPGRFAGHRGSMGVVVVTDRRLVVVEIDTGWRPDLVLSFAFSDLRKVTLTNTRRGVVQSVTNLEITARNEVFRVTGILPGQAAALRHALHDRVPGLG